MGVVKAVAVGGGTFGTGTFPDAAIAATVSRVFDLSPLGIIKELNLRRPLFRHTAVYGHFGRTDIDAPWESTARAKELAEDLSLPPSPSRTTPSSPPAPPAPAS